MGGADFKVYAHVVAHAGNVRISFLIGQAARSSRASGFVQANSTVRTRELLTLFLLYACDEAHSVVSLACHRACPRWNKPHPVPASFPAFRGTALHCQSTSTMRKMQ